MKRSQKLEIINYLKEQINSYNHFYLADTADLNALDTSSLRRLCFGKQIKLIVVKNTLLRRAFDESDKDVKELYDVLKGNTSILLSNEGNAPAKLIKTCAKKFGKPVLKAAFVEESIYKGADQLDTLVSIKSKNEMIADIIGSLQLPIQTVLGQLQSAGNTIHGVLQTLSEKKDEK